MLISLESVVPVQNRRLCAHPIYQFWGGGGENAARFGVGVSIIENQFYFSWFLGFLGIRHFQAISAIISEQNEALSGKIRHFQGHGFA